MNGNCFHPRITRIACGVLGGLFLAGGSAPADKRPAAPSRELTADLDLDGVSECWRWEVLPDGRLQFTFPPPHGHATPPGSICLQKPACDGTPRIVDLDGDGYDDIAAGEELLISGQRWARIREARSLSYRPIWNTGDDLRNVWDAEVVDLDQDGLREVMAQSYHYPGTLVHLYECDGNDSFALSWLGDTLQTPSLNSICGADTDRDDQYEVIAGEVGTLGRVYMWECVGDDSFVWRPLGFSMQPYDGAIKDLLVEDGDGDGRPEIVVCTGSAADGSAVGFFEHSGAVGENSYSEVFAYETVSYLFGIESGDSDNDGQREIILNVGGATGYPLYLRRLEYNPQLQTYEHKMITPGPIGLPLSAAVGNIDDDPENELIIGAGVPAGGAIYIFESPSDDLYSLVWSSAFEIPGTPQDVSIGPPNEYGYPTVAVSSFEGQIDIVGFDGDGYVRHLDPPLQIGHAVRSLDHLCADHPDLLADLVLAVSGDDRVRVFEREDAAAVDPARDGPRRTVRICAQPNPFVAVTTLTLALESGREAGATPRFAIYDASGRCVRRLVGNRICGDLLRAEWDGRGFGGRLLPSGSYYVRLDSPGRQREQPLLRLR